MAGKALNGVLQRVRLLAAVQTERAHSDPALLRRFVEQKDEAAFTVLIERHGPMVLGVCQRTLQHAQDAEDACQATFLVFARKAGSIRKTASLGSWLHGIACRIAANLARQRARRWKREQHKRAQASPPQAPADAVRNWQEVQSVLDAELEQLPERYRAPLLLCYWEGKTRDEAAGQLAVSVGKLHGLLERGRRLLRDRLTQRGLTLSAALCASLLTAGTTKAALAPTLVVAVTRAASVIAEGKTLSPDLVSSQVVTLVKEALTGMFFTKLKLATASVLCIGLAAALIGGSLATPGSAQNPPGQAAPAKQLASPESDEAFIRRVSKDLRGVEPTPTEVHFFVNNKDANRRDKLVDLFIQERQAKLKEGDDVKVRSVTMALNDIVRARTFLEKMQKADENAKPAQADPLDTRRKQLKAELKKIQDELDGLERTSVQVFYRKAIAKVTRARTPSVIALQGAFFKALAKTADEKKPATAALQDYLDALLKYLDNHPKASDVPDAMVQIELTYRAQDKTVEADAWRAKLKKEHPDSPAAKRQVSMAERERLFQSVLTDVESIGAFFDEFADSELQSLWRRDSPDSDKSRERIGSEEK